MRLVVVALAVLASCDYLLGLDKLPDGGRDVLLEGLPPDSLDDGLVAHWTLDDATWADATGHGHTGTCTSSGSAACPTFVPGHLGSAASFDGSGSLIHVPATGELRTEAGFTVAVWAWLYSTSQGCLVSKPYNAGDSDTWQICLANPGQLAFYATGALSDVRTPVPLSFDEWHHVAIRLDTAGHMTIVIDGAEVAVGLGSAAFSDDDILIGGDINTGGVLIAQYLGLLDDLRIYARAVSTPELATLAAH